MQFGVQSHIFSLTFRVIVCFQFGIQSLHISSFFVFKATSLVWNSELLFVFSLAFRVVICSFSSIFIVTMSFFHLVFKAVGFFQFDIPNHHVFLPFGVQSRVFHLAFRAMSLVRHSKPLFVIDIQHHVFLSSSVQNHCLVWRLEPYLQFGIQSHCFFFSSAFRAIMSFFHLEFRVTIFSFVWSLELRLHFGIQSHCSTWHSVPPSFFSFGIQSHCAYSFQHFESPFFLSFVVQSHFSSTLSFRVIAPSIHTHWHCISCLHNFACILIFLTSLLRSYCFFTMFFQTFPSTTHNILL